MKKKLPLLVLTLFVSVLAQSQPGSIDSFFSKDFGVGSVAITNGSVYASKILPDGKILVLTGGVRRLNPDGTPDDSFTQLPYQATDMVLQPDGKIILFGDKVPGRIARLNADGTEDSSFNIGTGAGGGTTEVASIYAAAVQDDGKIIIGGLFTSFNETVRNRIARLNTDGSLDITFNPDAGASWAVTAIACQSDGKIIIGGVFSSYNGTDRGGIARLNTDGSLDVSFDPGTGTKGNGAIESIVLQADGKIIIVGSFTQYNDISRWRIARINMDGSLDLSLTPGSGTDNAIYDADIQPDGKIIIGGTFSRYDGVDIRGIARLNTDGELDDTFKPYDGAASDLQGVANVTVQPDGKILISGSFTKVNGTTRNGIARLNSDGTLEGGKGADNAIYTMTLQSDGKIFIGGDFLGYNGAGRNRIALLDANGSLDVSFNPFAGANNTVYSSAIQNDGKMIIAGNFTNYNGTVRNRIARLNTDGSLDATFDPAAGANGIIRSIVIQSDGKIIIAGEFTDYGGTTRNHVARLLSTGLLDLSFDPGTAANGNVQIAKLQPDGKILIGGGFTNYNEVDKNRVIRLNSDGTLDATFNIGTGADANVHAITLQPDGKILIGGAFANFNGTGINRIARLNTDGTLDISFVPDATASDYVRTIALQSDGKIVIGGDFAAKVARLNTDGTTDAFFSSELAADNNVQSVVVQPDGKIIIAGLFTSYDGVDRNRIVRLNADGKGDQTITFSALPAKTFGDESFDLDAIASSGLEMTYVSSNPDVATVDGKSVTIVGAGETSITASQAGDERYNAAAEVSQTFTVNKADQTIAVDILGFISATEPIELIATATSGLPVSFTSSNPAAATISGNMLVPVASGVTTITATQTGNANYNPAEPVSADVTLDIEMVTAIESDPLVSQTKVYPNPTTGVVSIDGPFGNLHQGSVSLVDPMGTSVKAGAYQFAFNHMGLDLNMLPQGIYTVTITTGTSRVSRRIVKN